MYEYFKQAGCERTRVYPKVSVLNQ